MPIVFGGIQSVAKAIARSLEDDSNQLLPQHMKHFGWRDLIFIDEAHLLSPNEDTEYQYVIAELKKINPQLKVIGFTATPYRMKQGMITDDDGIFTDICYDITGIEAFNRMIAEGFMSPIIAKPTRTIIDVSGVGMVGSEFNQKQLDKVVDTDEITYKAVNEMIEYASNRNCWMVFGSSIDNAEHINAVLQSFGINSVVVHSKLKDSDQRILDFQNGQYQCIVNKDQLTTGFDHPPIDFIGDLQPTMSPGKHVQKWGRGTPFASNAKEQLLRVGLRGQRS
jgi:DNA repair protein RadD